MKAVALVAFFLGVSLGWPLEPGMKPLDDPSWKAWKSFHKKSYSDEQEETVRNFIWHDNLKRILSHNDEGHKYKLAMNHLGDLVSSFTLRCIFSFVTNCLTLQPLDSQSETLVNSEFFNF